MSERGNDEQSSSSEREVIPYCRASRFLTTEHAQWVYAQVQEAIFVHDCDLSTYRFSLHQLSHVLVLGCRPAEDLENQIAALLASGMPVALPDELLQTLRERRDQATQLGPWVEGHYRPGTPLGKRRTP
jgi:hypothetical protein